MYDKRSALQRAYGYPYRMEYGSSPAFHWTHLAVAYTRAQRRAIRQALVDEFREPDARVRRVGIFRNKGVEVRTSRTESKDVRKVCLRAMGLEERITLEVSELMPEIDQFLRRH